MADANPSLPTTREVIEQGIAAGLHIGAQVAVSLRGALAAELVVGESRPGVAMVPDTLVLWLSSTKPIVAASILQQVERGRLELDAPVATWLPAFAAQGKQDVSIRHLLTHTAGFRWVEVGWPQSDWSTIIDRLCAARLERGWQPGAKAGYHPFTSWYVLGELVRLADGRPLNQYVREEIFLPLAMPDCWIGMPDEQYDAYGDRLAILPDMEQPGRPPHRYSSRHGTTACIPGAGGYGPMRQLLHFYEMLLAGGVRQDRRVLSAESVRAMTERQRVGMFDETFKATIDWGLGTIVDSKRYGSEDVPYGYGKFASDATFGHSGSQSSAAFADPAQGLAVACYLNGTPGEVRHQKRMRTVLDAIYTDLGLGQGTGD